MKSPIDLEGKIYKTIDKDILDLIFELNKLGFLRTSHSCSGHDRKDPYVAFIVLDVKKTFQFFYDLMGHLDNFAHKKYGLQNPQMQFVSGSFRNTAAIFLNTYHGRKHRPYKEIMELWKEMLKFVKQYC